MRYHARVDMSNSFDGGAREKGRFARWPSYMKRFVPPPKEKGRKKRSCNS